MSAYQETGDCKVMVASTRFDEPSDTAYLLESMAGRQVQLPGNRDYWPDKTHLAWHWGQRFAPEVDCETKPKLKTYA